MSNNSRPISVNNLQKCKDKNIKITALTAYDYSTAKRIDEAGIDIILVGDSLAMVALGYETTHNVTMDEMLVFTKAVSRGVQRALVVADMPFGSYQASAEEGIRNAIRFIKEAGAKAIKLEGASNVTLNIVSQCVQSGVPVLGHLGFTPQFLHTIGGYNVQGKDEEKINEILKQAKNLQQAGAFAIVLEMMPEEAARFITENISIPTIGIGAGRYCSGQILVSDDLIGKYGDFTPKFARKYANISSVLNEAFSNYKNDVLENKFPSEEEIFTLNKVLNV